MTGAELLALARHNRGAGETDADVAMHLAIALEMLFRTLSAVHRYEVRGVLGRLLREEQANGGWVAHCEYDQGITPWTR